MSTIGMQTLLDLVGALDDGLNINSASRLSESPVA